MWESRVESLDDHDVRRVTVLSDGKDLSYLDVLHHWRHDPRFRNYFESLMRRYESSVNKVAQHAGVERTHLYRKLRSLGINPKGSN